jgi:DNA repair protein RadD
MASLSTDPNKLKITYVDEDGHALSETFNFSNPKALLAFNRQFGGRVAQGTVSFTFTTTSEAIALSTRITPPDFVIAKKQKYYWKIQEKIFDYQGNYRKANQM